MRTGDVLARRRQLCSEMEFVAQASPWNMDRSFSARAASLMHPPGGKLSGPPCAAPADRMNTTDFSEANEYASTRHNRTQQDRPEPHRSHSATQSVNMTIVSSWKATISFRTPTNKFACRVPLDPNVGPGSRGSASVAATRRLQTQPGRALGRSYPNSGQPDVRAIGRTSAIGHALGRRRARAPALPWTTGGHGCIVV